MKQSRAAIDSTIELYNMLEEKLKKKSKWFCCFN